MTTAPFPSELAPLTLSYRPDLGVLTVRWLRDVTFEELQEGFRSASALSHTHQATCWLVDVRRRVMLDAFQSEWVAQRLLPEMAATLAPDPLFVAYLLAPARVENIRLEPALRATVAQAEHSSQAYRLRTFADEGPAMQWLLAQQQPSHE
ncbi:hypothetical protein [Hymenobacter persicinus]|uniref:STAS/SEC14 domain-containing protein n=1 Tax=Hymenobacter persicinus TaxID=2025506 RepID=A0A4Q5LG70_9BACT|nr:hypothetical protein [Hymenobacter persicinus]RYU82193.1 hypothetical protein EWM57_05275 [Hymenobacter persicinus]